MNNKKKLVFSGLSVAAVVAGVAATGGTSAYFYDLERSENNSLSACSLDLVQQTVSVDQVGWAEDNPKTNATEMQSQADKNVSVVGAGGLSTITLGELQPGDAFDVTINMENEGNCAGEMWGDINFPITDNENTRLEPEIAAGDTTDGDFTNPQASQGHVGGDLDDTIEVQYTTDDAGNTFNGTYHDLAYLPPYLMDDDFQAGEVNAVKLRLTVPDNGSAGDGNEIMGDSFTFAIDFAAAQKNKLQPRNGGTGLDLNNPSTLD